MIAIKPFLWKLAWTLDIQQTIHTDENPEGILTINDLNLAAAVISFIMLEANNLYLKHIHLAVFCANISDVACVYKLRNSQSIVAGYLLRCLELYIHQSNASSVISYCISGENNIMSDVISHVFKLRKYIAASQN